MIEVTDADFEAVVIKSTIPVLVDVWATWCGPCKHLAPTIDALAEKYAGRVLVVKANIDQNSKAVADYGIRSIPMLLWFTKGKDGVLAVGFASQEKLEGLIDAKLAKPTPVSSNGRTGPFEGSNIGSNPVAGAK